uniref:ATP synthase CF1 subunit f n=1 Tax=Compsopogon caeruleus TaxID=31354 RepID=A0A1Z1XB66_9RHOD|nr:ATP synthase CF1 subunit f [Compsopogon caeruleus]ARX96111.1 ATP synthase CF1 subunit f [Compsopogon caeruleus]
MRISIFMSISENFFQIFQLIAQHSSESMFGFNFDILGTNFINISILLGIVIYIGKPFLTQTLESRQEKVLAAIQESEERLAQANLRLTEAQKQLAQTQRINNFYFMRCMYINLRVHFLQGLLIITHYNRFVIDQIKGESDATAAKVRESIIAQGKLDIERLKASSKVTIANTEAQIIRQIQEQIANLALKRVILHLKGTINIDAQARIIDSNISQLGGKF